jgi:hypothetical protein
MRREVRGTCDVGDGGLHYAKGVRADVARHAAAVAVAREAQSLAREHRRTIGPLRAIGLTNGGAESDDAGHAVKRVVAVLGCGEAERFDFVPPLPLAVGILDFEELVIEPGEHRGVLELEGLAGLAEGALKDLAEDGSGVGGACSATGGVDGDGLDLRGCRVRRLIGPGLHHAEADPVERLLRKDARLHVVREVNDDGAELVQATSPVGLHSAALPAERGAAPRLPGERGVPGIDPDALNDAIDGEREDVGVDSLHESEVERLTGEGHTLEGVRIVAVTGHAGEVVNVVRIVG